METLTGPRCDIAGDEDPDTSHLDQPEFEAASQEGSKQ